MITGSRPAIIAEQDGTQVTTPLTQTRSAVTTKHGSQGALRRENGSVQWRLWAPAHEEVTLVMWRGSEKTAVAMRRDGEYFLHEEDDVEEGLRYAYRLLDGRELPDPASRWQPEGVHRPSAVFSSRGHTWHDRGWRGIRREELVIYELHVGTFTPEGTFDAIIPRLAELRRLGVTALEIMPIAQFPGERNWGYDGVHPFAAQNSYGGPQGLARLVDAAHQIGMGVFLDVVYNHLGPEGNYFREFGPYFTDRYRTPWGDAVNYDGPDSDAVRQFVVDNACYWVREFHLDGLRLDAVHAIYDFGARHILAEIQEAVKREAARQDRLVHIIAESDLSDVRLIQPADRGGFGLDAVWADDFHHSVHALFTGEREGYFVDFGAPEHLAKAYEDVYVYNGRYSPFRRRRHGNSTAGIDRSQFVVCVTNHDQIGNRALGDRVKASLPPQMQRLACGLMFMSPCIPMLFMGEEYGETRPFPFFCSFGDADLIDAVRRGRREEFAALEFEWGTGIPDPQAPATFASARLAWDWPEGSIHEKIRRLYADLLAARRQWPPVRDRHCLRTRLLPAPDPLEGQGEGAILLIERGEGTGVLGVANLTAAVQPMPEFSLLGRELLLSTAESRYGGPRTTSEIPGRLHPHELAIFGWGNVGWRGGES